MSETPGAGCRQILSRISAYLDGDLDETTCARIAEHCEACPRCAAVVDGLRATAGLCRQAGSAPLPESVRQRARAAVRQLLEAEAARQRS
jgi:anti-sigma factor RsiW